jgi:hypothetical protein
MEAAAAKGVGAEVKELPLAERWRYRFHDLRHFSATTLVAAGVDIRTVAYRLGHAQPTLTLNLYAHALPERDRHAAAVLSGMLTRGSGCFRNNGAEPPEGIEGRCSEGKQTRRTERPADHKSTTA